MKLKNVILLLFLLLLITGCSREYKQYSKIIGLSDKNIKIVFYSSNRNKAKEVLKEIEKIYIKFDKLTNNKLSNQDLKEIKEYGGSWYDDSDHYINIYSKQVAIDWQKKNYNKKYSFNKAFSKNINLSMIADGLANKKVYDYLNKVGIKKYIIQNGTSVVTGLSNDNKPYRVGVTNPFDDSMLHLFLVNNKYITTKTINENYIKRNEEKYSMIVDAKKGVLSNQNVSVTVISDNPRTSEFLANTLFVMDYKTGKKFIKKYNAKAIWCYKDNDKEIIKYSKNLDA